jgi:hypothetical protein
MSDEKGVTTYTIVLPDSAHRGRVRLRAGSGWRVEGEWEWDSPTTTVHTVTLADADIEEFLRTGRLPWEGEP